MGRPSRTMAIGDILGCARALAVLLGAIVLGPEDLIITLGDYVNRVKCIDTDCLGGGWLTGIEVNTGAVWQSNRSGELREERRDS
jgi:hypothetical protein